MRLTRLRLTQFRRGQFRSARIRLSQVLLPALVLLVGVSTPAIAQKDAKSQPKDRAAISACLKQVQADYDAYEKLSPKAREKADTPQPATSCIGAVSGPCMEKAGNQSTKTEITCSNREQAVWQNFLNSRVQAYLKAAKPNQAAAMGKVNATWQTYRTARCAYPSIDNTDASVAGAQTASCRLTMTAQHALWIDVRENQ